MQVKVFVCLLSNFSVRDEVKKFEQVGSNVGQMFVFLVDSFFSQAA